MKGQGGGISTKMVNQDTLYKNEGQIKIFSSKLKLRKTEVDLQNNRNSDL